MLIDVAATEKSWIEIYRLCIGFINPRPIALASTISADGRTNLAPYSFYNMVAANPPVVFISAGVKRDGRGKDTYQNIKQTGEFVIATVTAPLAERMVRAAADLPYGESEFEFAPFSARPATCVRPPLVAESPINIECRLRQIVPIGDGPGAAQVIFGDIVAIHVDDAVLDADGHVDPHKLPTVGRLGGAYYANVTAPYELHIPPT